MKPIWVLVILVAIIIVGFGISFAATERGVAIGASLGKTNSNKNGGNGQ